MFRRVLGNTDDGGTLANPLALSDVKREELHPLLQVLYPKYVPISLKSLATQAYPSRYYGTPPNLTRTEWVSVMRLSSKWGMEPIRSLANDALRTIITDDPVLAICLARDCGLDHWIKPAVTNLVKRQRSLAPNEIRALGDEYSSRICKIREMAIDIIALRGDVYDCRRNLLILPHRCNVDFTSLIDYEFPSVNQN